MWYQIVSYLKFLKKATNQHGVHSPFVYNLVTKCFYQKSSRNKVELLNNYRSKLLQNNNTIEVTDFGKGSKIFKSNQRQISKIAKVAGISKKRAELLARIVSYFNSNKILEIGTSLGIGTASLHLGSTNAKITTLEGCPQTIQTAKETFDYFDYQNVNFVVGDFTNTLPKVLKAGTYDLIYFDGNHQKEPTLNYFRQCLSSVHNNSVFIFDDVHWTKDMEEAWKEIKQHPKVTVTIDTFFWGIVFFRKEQAKEHFTIRV
ncbi:class I SAM-dependent methyltransferase [Urechidicola sp. KH5]